jgi:UDP-N-acetylglucosamine 2-epimerase (non-hydrolysing)
MKILSVVGARPNFMKIAPFIKAISSVNMPNDKKIKHVLVHTGQHYDNRMSDSFFKTLGIPKPDINMDIGSGSHAEQVGNTMIAFEKVIIEEKPDWVVVVGDVNATLACSVTAKKLDIKVCHIEAGLRSNDITMPEEINRLVTDRLSDLLLIPDRISGLNLKAEGVDGSRISFVGNIMIDTLESNREKANSLSLQSIVKDNLLFEKSIESFNDNFALVTMHRPSNVDKKEVLKSIVEFLTNEVIKDMKIIWPIHPRTQNRLEEFGLMKDVQNNPNVLLLYPIGYIEMLRLNMLANIILTDSGGLQEESCVLGTPCLTLRWNTERPITLRQNGGASVLVGNSIDLIRKEYQETLKLDRSPKKPELWDGMTAERCVNAIINYK